MEKQTKFKPFPKKRKIKSNSDDLWTWFCQGGDILDQAGTDTGNLLI